MNLSWVRRVWSRNNFRITYFGFLCFLLGLSDNPSILISDFMHCLASHCKRWSSMLPPNFFIFLHWEQELQSGLLHGPHFLHPFFDFLILLISPWKTVSKKCLTSGVVSAFVAWGLIRFNLPEPSSSLE